MPNPAKDEKMKRQFTALEIKKGLIVTAATAIIFLLGTTYFIEDFLRIKFEPSMSTSARVVKIVERPCTLKRAINCYTPVYAFINNNREQKLVLGKHESAKHESRYAINEIVDINYALKDNSNVFAKGMMVTSYFIACFGYGIAAFLIFGTIWDYIFKYKPAIKNKKNRVS